MNEREEGEGKARQEEIRKLIERQALRSFLLVEHLDREHDDVTLVARWRDKVVVLVVAETERKVAIVLERWRDGNVSTVEGLGHGDAPLAQLELATRQENRALLELVTVAHQDLEHERVESEVRLDLGRHFGVELDLDRVRVHDCSRH